MDAVCQVLSKSLLHNALVQRDSLVQRTKLQYARLAEQLSKQQTAILASIQQQYDQHIELINTALVEHFKQKSSSCSRKDCCLKFTSPLNAPVWHTQQCSGCKRKQQLSDPLWSETVLKDEANVPMSSKDLQHLIVALHGLEVEELVV